jgi:hypothetical protein
MALFHHLKQHSGWKDLVVKEHRILLIGGRNSHPESSSGLRFAGLEKAPNGGTVSRW